MTRILLTSALALILGAFALADDSKPDAKKTEPVVKKADAKPAPAKAETKPAPKAETKPAPAKSEDKPAPKAETKPAAKPQSKAEILKAKAAASPTKAVVPSGPGTVSFMKDIAPILVQNCIACHNPRKSESKYVMTNFAQLAKGGQAGEGITLTPGNPDESFLVEVVRPDGEPRMPYKQDPLPADKLALIEKWVKEGAKYDGGTQSEDWTAVLRKSTPVNIPESYPVPVPVTALAFTPDGKAVASSGYHEVNLWKSDSVALDRRLRTVGERVYDIAYSSNGKWLATASGDPGQFGSVKLWLVEPNGGGKLVRELLDCNDSVYAVAFSPDNKKLAAAGADRAIRIWDVDTGKELALIEDHADWIFDLAFSPDGKRLASASRDKTSKVFDVEKKESLVTFPTHADTVFCVGFSGDGKLVATGGNDNQIRIWNPDDDAKQVRTISGYGGAVFRLQFTKDGKQIVSAGADKTVRVHNAADGKSIRSMSGHTDWIYALAISPDDKSVVSGSWDGEVRQWNLADGKPGQVFTAAPGLKSAAAAAPASPPSK